MGSSLSAMSRQPQDERMWLRHRSLNCREPTVVDFTNASEHPCVVTWLDYKGFSREYKRLDPGEAYRQPTFTTHPWTFRPIYEPQQAPVVLAVNHQQVFYPPPRGEGVAAVPIDICTVPPLVWSPTTHALYPASFRLAVQAVLLAHRRLQAGGESAPPSPEEPSSQRMRMETRAMARQRSSPPPANLANLPKDLLLDVLHAAAPRALHLAKPPVPKPVDRGTLTPKHLAVLFA